MAKGRTVETEGRRKERKRALGDPHGQGAKSFSHGNTLFCLSQALPKPVVPNLGIIHQNHLASLSTKFGNPVRSE